MQRRRCSRSRHYIAASACSSCARRFCCRRRQGRGRHRGWPNRPVRHPRRRVPQAHRGCSEPLQGKPATGAAFSAGGDGRDPKSPCCCPEPIRDPSIDIQRVILLLMAHFARTSSLCSSQVKPFRFSWSFCRLPCQHSHCQHQKQEIISIITIIIHRHCYSHHRHHHHHHQQQQQYDGRYSFGLHK
jgi:hypothetical protein